MPDLLENTHIRINHVKKPQCPPLSLSPLSFASSHAYCVVHSNLSTLNLSSSSSQLNIFIFPPCSSSTSSPPCLPSPSSSSSGVKTSGSSYLWFGEQRNSMIAFCFLPSSSLPPPICSRIPSLSLSVEEEEDL